MLFSPGTEKRFVGPASRDLVAGSHRERIGTNRPEGTREELVVDTIVNILYFVRVGGTWRMLGSNWGF